MGNDERAPPFFFAKHADMLVPDGATIPYPPLTKDLHHEVELVVAMKSGGLNIPADKALDHVYGYASASTSPAATCRSPRARRSGRGKSASPSTIPRPAPRCSRPPRSAIPPRAGSGSPSTAPSSQKGDLTELIWNVPEIIWQLSQQVALAAGDIIMTGTPAGVSAAQARRQDRMRRRRRRHAEGDDRQAGIAGRPHPPGKLGPRTAFGAFFMAEFARRISPQNLGWWRRKSYGSKAGAAGPQPRAIACRPLKVRRLGSFTPAR